MSMFLIFVNKHEYVCECAQTLSYYLFLYRSIWIKCDDYGFWAQILNFHKLNLCVHSLLSFVCAVRNAFIYQSTMLKWKQLLKIHGNENFLMEIQQWYVDKLYIAISIIWNLKTNKFSILAKLSATTKWLAIVYCQ